jgi:hypothetical protein
MRAHSFAQACAATRSATGRATNGAPAFRSDTVRRASAVTQQNHSTGINWLTIDKNGVAGANVIGHRLGAMVDNSTQLSLAVRLCSSTLTDRITNFINLRPNTLFHSITYVSR